MQMELVCQNAAWSHEQWQQQTILVIYKITTEKHWRCSNYKMRNEKGETLNRELQSAFTHDDGKEISQMDKTPY